MSKKLTTECFIKRAIKVHGDKYLYHKVVYVESSKKVILVCKEHGNFSQTASSHLQGVGCRKCHIKGRKKFLFKGKKEGFIPKAILKHGDYYDYSLFDYTGIDSKSIFICPIHGEFKQTPYLHLSSKTACFKCSVAHRADLNRKLPIELAKLKKTYKRRVKIFLNGKGLRKRKEVESILGLSWKLFKEYLEDNPYGFKIDDKGLDLDHIIPLSSAVTEEDFLKLNYYTNFQLLPRRYNQHIKRANAFNQKSFEEWLKTNYNK